MNKNEDKVHISLHSTYTVHTALVASKHHLLTTPEETKAHIPLTNNLAFGTAGMSIFCTSIFYHDSLKQLFLHKFSQN